MTITPYQYAGPGVGAGEGLEVWMVDMDAMDSEAAPYRDMLSPDERARADRFIFPEHGRRFTLMRGALRILLGERLGVVPDAVAFTYGERGKPALTGMNPHDWRFNISHSASRGLIALTQGSEVGVDIEQIKPDRRLLDIAARFFSPAERDVLEGLSPDDVPAAFYRCWSRKEAYIKARGDGLYLPLDQFSVSLHPDEPPGLMEALFDPAETSRWEFREVETGEGFMGALALAV